MDEELRKKIIEHLKTVYDPEIPVDIYELGLIYKLESDNDNNVKIDMTLTSPNCPVAEDLPMWVQQSVEKVKEVKSVKVEIVWEPPWDQSMMSEAARVELNLM